VRVFEIGRVFLRDALVDSSDTTVKGFDQPMRLAGLAAGASDAPEWGVKERAVDFFDVKGDIEALLAPLRASFAPAQHPALHPGRCAQIMLADVAVGFVGELHPKWRQSYELSQTPMLFELDLAAILSRQVPAFKPVPKFQAVERDIAVLVDEHISHDALMNAIWAAPVQGTLRDALLFDIYRPKSADVSSIKAAEKSMAVRLTLNGHEAALTEAQIDSTVAAIIATLSAQVGAKQRT
jgi:phenylalanyl-tRNA synthetase beta chain